MAYAISMGIGAAQSSIFSMTKEAATITLKEAALSGLGNLLGNFMPKIDIKIGDWAVSINPSILLGNSNGLGLNIQISYTEGNWNFSYGFGITDYAKYQNTGKSGVQFRNSFMATFDDGKTGFSLGTNIWGGDKGMSEFNQRTGMIGLHFGDFRATYENDGAPFGKYGIGDGNDRYRTAAVSMSVGKFTAGFNLFTGSRTKDSYSGDAQYVGKGCLGNYGERMPNDLVVETGPRYRMGAAYVGWGNYRTGIDSDRYIRHPIQDHFAHNWIGEKQPGFESLSNSTTPYFQYQTTNPFTSW